jgi:hypothetical protein
MFPGPAQLRHPLLRSGSTSQPCERISPPGDPSTVVLSLDNFSFFSPLDILFANIAQERARKASESYNSAFWFWEMFGYATWTPGLDTANDPQLSSTSDIAGIQAMATGDVALAGDAWDSQPRLGGNVTCTSTSVGDTPCDLFDESISSRTVLTSGSDHSAPVHTPGSLVMDTGGEKVAAGGGSRLELGAPRPTHQ